MLETRHHDKPPFSSVDYPLSRVGSPVQDAVCGFVVAAEAEKKMTDRTGEVENFVRPGYFRCLQIPLQQTPDIQSDAVSARSIGSKSPVESL